MALRLQTMKSPYANQNIFSKKTEEYQNVSESMRALKEVKDLLKNDIQVLKVQQEAIQKKVDTIEKKLENEKNNSKNDGRIVKIRECYNELSLLKSISRRKTNEKSKLDVTYISLEAKLNTMIKPS